MNEWLLLVLFFLTVYRVTRFITSDQFPLIAWPRETSLMFLYPDYAEDETRKRYNLKGKSSKPHWGEFGRSLAYLLACNWCVSIYVSTLGLLGLGILTPFIDGWHWVQIVMVGLAASAFTGFIASKED